MWEKDIKVSKEKHSLPCTSTSTTKFLGFTATGISNEECTVIGNKSSSDFLLCCFINVFLVEGDNGFGNGLTDG